MKKLRLLIIVFVFMMALSMAGCKNKTECEKNGHTWAEATCKEAKHCQICGEVEGVALEHRLVEATYLSAAYCEVCEKQFGERLVYDVVSLEDEWSIEGPFLTNEQYQNIDKYVKVYGILENGEKVELLNEDIETKTSNSNHISLFYRDVECVTDKVLLQLLEEIPLDFNQLQVMYDQTIIGNNYFSMVGIYLDSLREYLDKEGYTCISDYFASCGLTCPNISKMYSPTGVFVPMQYYNKDSYCIYVEKDALFDVSERAYQRIYVYKMPEKFVTMGLDLLLSDKIYNLSYRVEKSDSYTIGDSQNPILSIQGKRTTIDLQYFSKVEQDTLLDNISQFYDYPYATYQDGSITYYHFTGNEQNDIIIKIIPTAGEYADIEFSLIEKA